ncbi:unnamed protein product [Rhizophagus irregularis]|uniref:Uncharacterized protein n=1 Tax=Rhizophagus irregularis TaxID=588596 RepID=A0A916DZ27_9GLOM|nr:unnamed protein product [Rhizophagus irregularis]CAB5332519.1 unnamed protein product [Rhizophagus irregularis]
MSSSRNLTMQDLLNVLNNANNNDKQNNNLQTHASSTETHDLSFYNLSPEIISLPIPKQSGKYNLQKALGYFKKKRDNKNAKVVDGNRNSNEENNENHDSEIGETNNSEDRGEHDSISEPVQDSTRRSEKAKQTTAVQKKVVKQKRTNKRS